jgi:NAD(P)H-dependent FMN reductase
MRYYVLTAKREDLITELIDLRDCPLPFFNEPTSPITGHCVPEARAWAAEGDGYVFVAPKYNFGYPAVLKNALDHRYREWNNKPVAFVSYGGPAGGSRAVQQLREVVVELQMAPIRAGIVISFVRRLFDESGEIKDDSYNARANTLLGQLCGG